LIHDGAAQVVLKQIEDVIELNRLPDRIVQKRPPPVLGL
jgi:hypothetical protein